MSNEAWMTFFTVLALVMVFAIFVGAFRFVNGMRRAQRRRAARDADRPVSSPTRGVGAQATPIRPSRRNKRPVDSAPPPRRSSYRGQADTSRRD
jgi:hypothetical protein